MPHATARTLSILGHPLLMLPVGILLPTLQGPMPADTLAIVTGFAAFALAVMLWSGYQVRRGRWAHVDASHIDERRALNRFLLPAILIGAALAWLLSSPPRVAVAIASAAGIVLAAMLLTRWCKLSLHVAFAVFTTGLLWPLGRVAVLVAAVLTVAIAWSRLRLSRHAPVDLLAGAAAGALAAMAVWLTTAWTLVPRVGA